MPETSPSFATDGQPRRPRRAARLALQVALLCLVFSLWRAVGQSWHLPLPAGLLAMLTLLALLATRLLPLTWVHHGASFLLRHIALFFVPVCVGAVRQLPQLRGHGLGFAAVVIAAAMVGQATSGLLAQALCRKPVAEVAPEGFDA